MKTSIRVAGLALATCLTLLIAGCLSQQQLADLTNTLGDAVEQLATLEGQTALAAKLQIDVATASKQILAWKSGSTTADIVAALNLVEDDIALFPPVAQYAPAVDLAIATIDSLLEVFEHHASGAVSAHVAQARKYSVTAPKTADEFRKRWNAVAAPEAKI